MGELFPKSKCYNWPNPVYDNNTFIRFYLNEDSDVKIRIFDLAGDKVDEITYTAQGKYDNEVKWNTEKIQSAVYFASLEAKSTSGKSETRIIKIAIVK